MHWIKSCVDFRVDLASREKISSVIPLFSLYPVSTLTFECISLNFFTQMLTYRRGAKDISIVKNVKHSSSKNPSFLSENIGI
jgi:hypothetical protein